MSRTSRWQTGLQVAVVLLIMGAFAPFLSSIAAQEPLTATVQVTATTVIPKTGEVTVQGTIQCSEPAEGYLGLHLSQSLGRYGKVIQGNENTFITCDGTQPSPYTLTLFASNGRFGPGRAVLRTVGSLCPTNSYPYPYPGQGCATITRAQAVRLQVGK